MYGALSSYGRLQLDLLEVRGAGAEVHAGSGSGEETGALLPEDNYRYVQFRYYDNLLLLATRV